jgi:hypothetical protein
MSWNWPWVGGWLGNWLGIEAAGDTTTATGAIPQVTATPPAGRTRVTARGAIPGLSSSAPIGVASGGGEQPQPGGGSTVRAIGRAVSGPIPSLALVPPTGRTRVVARGAIAGHSASAPAGRARVSAVARGHAWPPVVWTAPAGRARVRHPVRVDDEEELLLLAAAAEW